MLRLLTPSAAVYRPRHSIESDFHRLVREHFDDFRATYTARYAHKFGHWRPAIDRAVAAFLKCGDLRHGFARVRCPDCHWTIPKRLRILSVTCPLSVVR